ncbi:MAG: insertion element protein, partial [Bacillus sp. (in: Bacteria)]|nr:insertion element protein [Bacillus sp. (in: firmicutes)]
SRIFGDKIQLKDAQHFLCLSDKTITRKQTKAGFRDSLQTLKQWAEDSHIEYDTLQLLALRYIEEQLKTHTFHNRHITKNGEFYFTQGKNRLVHPIPTTDRGKRELDVITDGSHLTNFQLASLLVQVNDNAINGFLQAVRRRLSILERPLVTARGDGKSYIYSNFNPKYSQMAITILRTYYNFCLAYKANGKEETPAQRLGITNRIFTWEDIIYKR